jgi:hypothetical protein
MHINSRLHYAHFTGFIFFSVTGSKVHEIRKGAKSKCKESTLK